MAEYLWAKADGQIIGAEYNPSTDTLKNDQVQNILQNAFTQFGHTATCKPVSSDFGEVYEIILDGDTAKPIYVCAKGTTPGGRDNLKDEQRIQQKKEQINKAFDLSQKGYRTIHLGVYRRESQIIFCAWLLKHSDAAPNSPVSKQIKIKTIADAMKKGFVTQEKKDKAGMELACAFRKEFLFFYLENFRWFHKKPITTLTSHTTPLPDKTFTGLRKGENILLYGVPGCGKSHTIKTEFCDDEKFMERVVFHPDYTSSDFIGQIMPTNIDGHISYPFVPGPFTRILKKAIADSQHEYFLIIEEITRGNAPAIFGEVFQLLDRNEGVSEYGISNAEIAKEVYGDATKMVKIPSNLFVLATMNTADQNVFTLDTAFKRRWSMRSIKNDIANCEYADKTICGTAVTWRFFAETINELIIRLGQNSLSSEDKRLGAYFARETELNNASAFAEKILMYLWNDAFKYDHSAVFKPEYTTLEQLIAGFKTLHFGVFLDSIGFDNPDSELSSNTDEQQDQGET